MIETIKELLYSFGIIMLIMFVPLTFLYSIFEMVHSKTFLSGLTSIIVFMIAYGSIALTLIFIFKGDINE